MTMWRMRVASWISKATREHARIHTEICYTYWFSSVTVVSPTRLSVSLYAVVSVVDNHEKWGIC